VFSLSIRPLFSVPLGFAQTWFVSGEAFHPDLALLFRRRAAPGARLFNLYGSTEVVILLADRFVVELIDRRLAVADRWS